MHIVHKLLPSPRKKEVKLLALPQGEFNVILAESKEIIKSDLEELAKKIIELKENFQVNALNGLLDLKWNIGEKIGSRVNQQSLHYLANPPWKYDFAPTSIN